MNGTESLHRSAPQPGTAHLAVLHHGLWGSCRDLYFVEAKLIESGWLVLNSTCNSERYTYDGIDVCGDRLVRETHSCCNRWLSKGIRVTKISFIGYSLGGGSEDLLACQVLAATQTPVIYVHIVARYSSCDSLSPLLRRPRCSLCHWEAPGHGILSRGPTCERGDVCQSSHG